MTATATTSAPETRAPGQNVILHNVSWRTYECLLKDFENSSAPRFTYDRGTLEIMSPLPEHEHRNDVLASLVKEIANEWGWDCVNLGSTTFKRQDTLRGFEPDSCFYFEDNAGRIRSVGRQVDLVRDPAPDLVIEIDITSPSLPKLPLAQIGVPEVWRDTGETVEILGLVDGREYAPRTESRALGGLTSELLSHLLVDGLMLPRPAWLRTVRDWARRHAQGTDVA